MASCHIWGLKAQFQRAQIRDHKWQWAMEVIHPLSHYDLPVVVPVNGNVLSGVSSSALKAESWLRLHILPQFPAVKITTILVGDTIICQNDQGESFGNLLPSLNSSCLHQKSVDFSDDLAKKMGPLLAFYRHTYSTYTINPSANLSSTLHESSNLLSSHLDFMKRFGSFELAKVNVTVSSQEKKLYSWKLSVLDSKLVKPYTASPTPWPEISPSFQSSIGFSVPANVAK
ncbi:hypothetical protein DITRI_Ditri16bG0044200 [Diplodiscus trichospermus]